MATRSDEMQKLQHIISLQRKEILSLYEHVDMLTDKIRVYESAHQSSVFISSESKESNDFKREKVIELLHKICSLSECKRRFFIDSTPEWIPLFIDTMLHELDVFPSNKDIIVFRYIGDLTFVHKLCELYGYTKQEEVFRVGHIIEKTFYQCSKTPMYLHMSKQPWTIPTCDPTAPPTTPIDDPTTTPTTPIGDTTTTPTTPIGDPTTPPTTLPTILPTTPIGESTTLPTTPIGESTTPIGESTILPTTPIGESTILPTTPIGESTTLPTTPIGESTTPIGDSSIDCKEMNDDREVDSISEELEVFVCPIPQVQQTLRNAGYMVTTHKREDLIAMYRRPCWLTWKANALKALCFRQKLPISGTKGKLIERLESLPQHTLTEDVKQFWQISRNPQDVSANLSFTELKGIGELLHIPIKSESKEDLLRLIHSKSIQ